MWSVILIRAERGTRKDSLINYRRQVCHFLSGEVLDIEVRDEEYPSPVSEAFIRETRRDIRIALGSEKSVTRFMAS